MKNVFFLIIFISEACFAITREDIVKSVLTHFPLIEEAELKLKASEGEVISAEGAFDHKLSFKSRHRLEDKYDNKYFETIIEKQTSVAGTNLFAGHRQGKGTFPAYDGKYKTSSAGEIFAGLAVPLLRNFNTDEFRTNLAVRQIENKQTDEMVKLKKLITVHKALSVYYKWLLELQKLKINRNLFELADKRQKMLEKKYQAGDIEKIKLTDNFRAFDKRSTEVLKNEIELNKFKTELSLYLRDSQGNPKTINLESYQELTLPAPELGGLTENKINPNPQLEFLKLELSKLSIEQDYHNQLQKPGLNFEIIGSRELSPVNAAYDPESLQVGLKLDIPLENRKAEGKSVSTFYKMKSLEKQKNYLEQEINQQMNFFKNASMLSKTRWEIGTREFEGTINMAEAEKKKWLQGASDLFILNLREQDVADVEIRRLAALYDYHQYLLDFDLFRASLPIYYE
ncbi:MAG: TolC family protein [Bacteriovoracaceae bacterium]